MGEERKLAGHLPEITKKAHSCKFEDLMSEFGSSLHGLTEAQAGLNLSKYGPNEMQLAKQAGPLEILARQFKNILILMLIASSIVAFLVKHDPLDAIGILIAVALSVLFGFVQEYKAEQALSALRKMASPHANAIRGGKEIQIAASSIVPGDLLILSEGDMVPSDCRIVESSNLSCDQSALTGESHPSSKAPGRLAQKIPLAEKGNIVFAGTTVVRGHCRAVVFATANSSEFGKVASRLASLEDEPAPLQKQLSSLGENIGKAALALSFIFFIFGVWRGESLAEMLIVAVTLAVAAIPEGLPTVIAITMAIGVQRMASRNAIVRKLPAVETLGSTTVICTDKTGTLTENRMTLVKLYTKGKFYSLGGGPLELSGGLTVAGAGRTKRAADGSEYDDAKFALSCGVLCNTAAIFHKMGKNVESMRGDPTEVALLIGAQKLGIDVDEHRANHPQELELSFEYARKMMTQVRKNNSISRAYCKGAPEKIISLCTHVLTPKGVKPLSPAEKRRLAGVWEGYAKGALRTLAVAYKDMKTIKGKGSHSEIESGLVWVGVYGLIDPPRPEVPSAIAACQKAGIRVVMITGDSPHTAGVIASQLGLLTPGSFVFDGEQIEKMGKAELSRAVSKMAVCARATPEHKFLIVNALKKNGEIVAVTGDGVNDAPSIKAADIGVAMGQGGTDVARGASDMVFADNNFHTISIAISQGRSIYENIRSFVRFQFATNVAALTLMFSAPFLGLPLPLVPLQILWINIIMDGPPALALGVEPSRRDAMSSPPRKPSAPFMSKQLLSSIFASGIVMFVITLFVFASYMQASDFAHASTMAFTVFVALQLANALNCRSARQSAFSRFFANKALLAAVVVSLCLHLFIIYVPWLGAMFGTVPLSAYDWGVIAVAGLAMLVYEEGKKRLLPSSANY